MLDISSLLARFHRVLVEEIREKRPEYLDGPFTVAEIYQQLVPYGSHRDRLGVEMNGDYEDLLLRLLAGEGGYLRLESDAARSRLGAEVESTHPDTGIYREFAAADVRLEPGPLEEVAHAASGTSEARDGSEPAAAPDPGASSYVGSADGELWEPADQVASDEPAGASFAGPPRNGEEEPPPRTDTPREAPTTRDAALAEEPAPDGAEAEPVRAPSDPDGGAPPAVEEENAAPPTTCPWCREGLPHRSTLNYCPFCGADVRVVPCPSCGEALERNWRYCIACGAEVEGE